MESSAKNDRTYGCAPYAVAVVHGGPGAAGEMASVARELAHERGVLEPLQTATSLEGQVDELRLTLEACAALPVTLIGFSWGAWLSYILAAWHPALVHKLVLVSSGPFEERYVDMLRQTRLARLNAAHQAQWQAANVALGDPANTDKDAWLARLGALTDLTDLYDPIPSPSEDHEPVTASGAIFQAVWARAAEWRRSGKLLELAQHIRCPVVALHGDYDPHPARGVQEPLSARLKDFRFVMLGHCGHTPWRERQARAAFYQAVRLELPAPLAPDWNANAQP